MAKLKLLDGYQLAEEIIGDGKINLLIRKIDGSEADVVIGEFNNGKFIIPGSKIVEEGEAKLVYQITNDLTKFGIYATKENIPGDNDFNFIAETQLKYYIEVIE